MSDRDVLPTLGNVAKVFTDLVVEIDLAVFDEHHHRGRRKLLSNRAGLKHRLRFYRDLMLEIRESVAFDDQWLAIFDDGERHARDLLLLHLGLDEFVDFRRYRVLRKRRDRRS